MPPLRLFGWSRMTSADRCGMRHLRSQVDVMECHSVGVRVEGKATQCRVTEKTTCCHDTVWTDAVYGVTTGACMSRDCSSESA